MSHEHEGYAHHRTRVMVGRDPDEDHRVATSLELLFDLTFVIAVGVAGNEMAHAFAAGHLTSGVQGFAFATFAICWAWIQYSWFASAYDVDDWAYRLTTMLQMVGVLIITLGLPDVFESLVNGDHLNNTVVVAGYVVMRVAMVLHWWRASRQDACRALVGRSYIAAILVAQACWVLVVWWNPPTTLLFTVVAPMLILIELLGPYLAESKAGGSPWHPHHIAERYGLFTIIMLGEGLLGTMATLVAIVGPEGPGWSVDVIVIAIAGTALTFGMWWVYFNIPHGEYLHLVRSRAWGWGYGHVIMWGFVAATGAGLHVAAYYVDHHSKLGAVGSVASVAAPVTGYVIVLFLLYGHLTRHFDGFHVVLVAGSFALITAALVMATADVNVVWCLLVLSLTPWVTVVGYETLGHRHGQAVLERLFADPTLL